MARIIEKFGVKTVVTAVNEYKGALVCFVELGGVRYKLRLKEPFNPNESSPRFWLEIQKQETVL